MKQKILEMFDVTTIKFLLVGVINTLVGTGTMFLMFNLLHVGYWISTLSNYVVGSIVSYLLNKHFTFHNNQRGINPLIRFVVNISICYFVAYGAAKPLARMVLNRASQNIQENIAMLFGMCLFVGLNYIGQRYFVFSKRT